MKVYVKDVSDVELECAMSEQQLSYVVDACMNGLMHAQIFVTQGEKRGRLDVRDIDISRTLPNTLFNRTSIVPPSAA